jgi:hypothetical protein
MSDANVRADALQALTIAVLCRSDEPALARTLAVVISAVAIAILYLTNQLERRQPAG